MEALQEKGLTKAIGLSDARMTQLTQILGFCKTKPAVTSVEASPTFLQAPLTLAGSSLGCTDRELRRVKTVQVHPYCRNDRLIELCNAQVPFCLRFFTLCFTCSPLHVLRCGSGDGPFPVSCQCNHTLKRTVVSHAWCSRRLGSCAHDSRL